jgi:hypothetical protein
MITGIKYSFSLPDTVTVPSFNTVSKEPLFKFATEKGELPCKVGIEYTFISENKPLSSSDALDKFNKLDNLVNAASYKKGFTYLKEFNRIHFDNGCVEIPSPPHEKYDELINYYHRVTAISKEYGLVGWKNKYPGGGMHFHLEFPKNLQITDALKLLKYLYIDMANRPYLNWIFNEPMDNINANSFFVDKESYLFIQTIEKSDFFDYNALLAAKFWKKERPIRYNESTNTIEFRIFDTARSESELIAMLNFICNYYENFIIGLGLCDPIYFERPYFDFGRKLKHNARNFRNKKKLDQYLLDFLDLCKVLHLDYDNYVTFINRNYKTRLKWGKEYLK